MPPLRENEIGASSACKTCLLACRRDRCERFRQCVETSCCERRSAAKIFHEQSFVDAHIKVENAGAEASFTHMGGPSIVLKFFGPFQINCCEVVVFSYCFMSRHGVRDLYGGFDVVAGIIG